MSANPFTQHPHDIGETYWQHQRRALGFAFQLLGAGLAALVHALLPFLFVETGSRTISKLHTAMVTHRRAAPIASQDECACHQESAGATAR
ncbi:MAG: hypothetical protein JNN20_05140 [Betaproteobacteria bacterium]|nr:hypothetical protein [Betaproteobacteria bacterium]